MDDLKLDKAFDAVFELWLDKKLNDYDKNLYTINKELINIDELKLKASLNLYKMIDDYVKKNAIIEDISLPF